MYRMGGGRQWRCCATCCCQHRGRGDAERHGGWRAEAHYTMVRFHKKRLFGRHHKPFYAVDVRAVVNGHNALGNDAAMVIFFIGEVNRHSSNAFASGQNSLMHASSIHALASKFGEQGRMGVQNSPCKSLQRARTQFSKVAGQDDKVDFGADQRFAERSISFFSIRQRRDDSRGDFLLARECDSERCRPVAHHDARLGQQARTGCVRTCGSTRRPPRPSSGSRPISPAPPCRNRCRT
jgi:hypothetical protein